MVAALASTFNRRARRARRGLLLLATDSCGGRDRVERTARDGRRITATDALLPVRGSAQGEGEFDVHQDRHGLTEARARRETPSARRGYGLLIESEGWIERAD